MSVFGDTEGSSHTEADRDDVRARRLDVEALRTIASETPELVLRMTGGEARAIAVYSDENVGKRYGMVVPRFRLLAAAASKGHNAVMLCRAAKTYGAAHDVVRLRSRLEPKVYTIGSGGRIDHPVDEGRLQGLLIGASLLGLGPNGVFHSRYVEAVVRPYVVHFDGGHDVGLELRRVGVWVG